MSLDVVRAHVHNGELTLAREAVRNLLADAPEADRGELYAWLARLECRLGRPREALPAAEEATKRSDSWATALALGEAQLAVGEPFRARETLAAALDRLRAVRGGITNSSADPLAAHAGRPHPSAPSAGPSDPGGPSAGSSDAGTPSAGRSDPGASSAPSAGRSPPGPGAPSAPAAGSPPDARESATQAFREAAEAEVWLGVALAEAHRSAGEPETGLAVAMRAVAFAEHAFGGGSSELAEALHAVGSCQHAAGHELQAREALVRALALRRELGADHPDVAATLDALGLVERARNRPFDAVKRHREALAIWIGRLGEHAGPVGGCRHALAQALHRTGDFQGAREEMRQALLVTGRTFGANHVDTWIARFELGRFEVDCGQMEEGFQAMEAARTRVRELLGRDHPVAKAMDRWL